jgi:hypothetical protein
MNKLTEIGLQTRTDKADSHRFTEFYYDYCVKYTSPKLLEVGVSDGCSLNMWSQFYPTGEIVGMDIDISTFMSGQRIPYDATLREVKIGNITVYSGDQENKDDLLKSLNYHKEYDIIIDDGGHTMKQQQITLGTLFPYVKSGGLFIMEDLHTSFHGGYNPFDGNLSTYEIIEKISMNERFESPYITQDQVDYILDNTKSSKLLYHTFNDRGSHSTSVLEKK